MTGSLHQFVFATIPAVVCLIHICLGDSSHAIVVRSADRDNLTSPAKTVTVTGDHNVVIGDAGSASIVLHVGGENQTEGMEDLREGVAKLELDNARMRHRLDSAEK